MQGPRRPRSKAGSPLGRPGAGADAGQATCLPWPKQSRFGFQTRHCEERDSATKQSTAGIAPSPVVDCFASLAMTTKARVCPLSRGKRRRSFRFLAIGAGSAGGFTLIEILVAFTVAALLLGALYQAFSTGLRSSAAARNSDDAVLLAESGLDALSATTIAVGETSDRIGRFTRRSSVRARPDLATDAEVAVIPYQIDVEVAWRDGIRERTVSLSTLRAGPRETQR
jgi:general secretion pathway protein I